MIRKILLLSLLMISLLNLNNAFANDTLTIDIHRLNNDQSKQGIGEKIGTVSFKDTAAGLKIMPHLMGLAPGEHGFHIHLNPSCAAAEKENKLSAGEAAGGHFDPQHMGKHLGPNGPGHLGDLPVLVVDNQQKAEQVVIAAHLKLAQVKDHSIMIHEGGDNYSDHPPMGGGGARIACGVIK